MDCAPTMFAEFAVMADTDRALMNMKKKDLKKQRLPYSVGEINVLIDRFIHPLYRKNQSFRLLDGLLHFLNEQDPKNSIEKFAYYNLKDILMVNNPKKKNNKKR